MGMMPRRVDSLGVLGQSAPGPWHLPAFRAARQKAPHSAAPRCGQAWSQGACGGAEGGKKLSCVLPNTLCP